MATTYDPRLRVLILAGGQSSRMGSPKYLLPMPTDATRTHHQPLLVHLLKLLELVGSRHPDLFADRATVSVRSQVQLVEVKAILDEAQDVHHCGIDFVTDAVTDAGPAQGLLAAYGSDDTAHWLTLGCDYPLLGLDAINQLVVAHIASKRAVTCFQNHEGFAEPLLSIWTPSALSVLADLVKDSSRPVGPNHAIKSLQRAFDTHHLGEIREYERGVEFVQPPDSDCITSVDTQEQWNAAKALVQPFS